MKLSELHAAFWDAINEKLKKGEITHSDFGRLLGKQSEVMVNAGDLPPGDPSAAAVFRHSLTVAFRYAMETCPALREIAQGFLSRLDR